MMKVNMNFEDDSIPRDPIESGLTFVAAFGLVDQIREEAKVSIEKLAQASTVSRILTGDHKETATYVGE